MPNHHTPTLVIAGTASGVGKTTVVAGLLAAFRRRGVKTQPFKCGPDYIDPSYHSQAAGVPCRNLDSWMLDDNQVLASFDRACRGTDLAVIEGVMGLFDGTDFASDRASAAQIARLLGAPVVVILDISGAARSAAATALGFVRFDPALSVAGFILNRAGSEAHARGCATAIERETGRPVLGWLRQDESLGIPERHLGLVLEKEQGGRSTLIERLADIVTAQFDLEALLRVAATATLRPPPANNGPRPIETGVRRPLLAVARDAAFAFYYPDNLELLEAAGAEIRFFSPTAGEGLPEGTAGVYLGGGYPELHAQALSANDTLRRDLRDLHRRGAPIYAECGGFMMLTEALIDTAGNRWPMYGLVPGTTRMTPRIAGLGYRTATALADNLLIHKGATVRGHEFHYSCWETAPAAVNPAWNWEGASPSALESATGHTSGNLLASYLHVHFGQNPGLAETFVARLNGSQKS